jgi:hypothetical protein
MRMLVLIFLLLFGITMAQPEAENFAQDAHELQATLWSDSQPRQHARQILSGDEMDWTSELGPSSKPNLAVDQVALDIDAMGNSYSLYNNFSNARLDDIYLCKYDLDGNLQWTWHYDGPASGDDRAHNLHIAPDGSIFIPITTQINATTREKRIVRLSADGLELPFRLDAAATSTLAQLPDMQGSVMLSDHSIVLLFFTANADGATEITLLRIDSLARQANVKTMNYNREIRGSYPFHPTISSNSSDYLAVSFYGLQKYVSESVTRVSVYDESYFANIMLYDRHLRLITDINEVYRAPVYTDGNMKTLTPLAHVVTADTGLCYATTRLTDDRVIVQKRDSLRQTHWRVDENSYFSDYPAIQLAEDNGENILYLHTVLQKIGPAGDRLWYSNINDPSAQITGIDGQDNIYVHFSNGAVRAFAAENGQSSPGVTAQNANYTLGAVNSEGHSVFIDNATDLVKHRQNRPGWGEQWRQTLPTETYGYVRVLAGIVAENGQLIALISENGRSLMAMAVDRNGDEIWRKSIVENQYLTDASIRQSNPGEYTVLAFLSDTGELLSTTLDLSGNTIANFSDILTGESPYLHFSTIAADNTIRIVSQKYEENYKLIVRSYSRQGEMHQSWTSQFASYYLLFDYFVDDLGNNHLLYSEMEEPQRRVILWSTYANDGESRTTLTQSEHYSGLSFAFNGAGISFEQSPSADDGMFTLTKFNLRGERQWQEEFAGNYSNFVYSDQGFSVAYPHVLYPSPHSLSHFNADGSASEKRPIPLSFHAGKLYLQSNQGLALSYHFDATPGLAFSYFDTRNNNILGTYAHQFSNGENIESVNAYMSEAHGLVYLAVTKRSGITLMGVDVAGRSGQDVETFSDFAIVSAYPNPFNSSTRIEFTLPEATSVQFRVYNAIGREVYRNTSFYGAGRHFQAFNPITRASGIYFVQMQALGQVQTRKLVMIK